MIKKKLGVQLFALPVVFENSLVSVTRDGQIVKIDPHNLAFEHLCDINEYKLQETSEFSVIGISGKNLIVRLLSIEKAVILIINLESGATDKIEIEDAVYYGFIVKDKYLLLSQREKVVLFDLSTKNKKWELPGHFYFLIEFDKGFVVPDSRQLGSIKHYSIDDGELNWRKDLSEVGDYIDILGDLNKGKIRETAYKAGESIIIGIDGYHILSLHAGNGQENWRLKLNSEKPFFGFDSRDGFIYIIDHQNYLIVDSKTGKTVENFDFSSFYEKVGKDVVGFNDFTFSSDFLYAVNPRKSLILGFDKKNGSLIWSEKINEFIPKTNPPLFLFDKLFVLTETGTLNIFE